MKIVFTAPPSHFDKDWGREKFTTSIWDNNGLEYFLRSNDIRLLREKGKFIEYNDAYHFWKFDLFPDEYLWKTRTESELQEMVNSEARKLEAVLRTEGYKYHLTSKWTWDNRYDDDKPSQLPLVPRKIPGVNVWIYSPDKESEQG